MLPTKFQVNCPFGSEEVKNRFIRWPPWWWPPWISECFLPSFESIDLLVQENKRKIDFQDGQNDCDFGFHIGTILAIFELQVTPMLPTKFRAN